MQCTVPAAKRQQVEASHSSGVTDLYLHKRQRQTARDRQTERERERETEKRENYFSVQAKASRKETLMTSGGVKPSTFGLKSISSTD